MDQETRNLLPGLTFRSLAASIFGLLLMGIYVQYAEIIQVSAGAIGEQSLPIPGMTVFVFLLVLAAAVRYTIKYRLLTRQELFCVLFSLLIAAPMMTQGMWHRFVGIIAATPRDGNFHYMDALNDKLWPHGPNVVEGAMDEPSDQLAVIGQATWEDREIEIGQHASTLVLRNDQRDQVSSVSLKIPLEDEQRQLLNPGEPYLVSFLAKPDNLASDSFYFVRFHADDSDSFREVINTRDPSQVTFLHKTGFVRIGKYNVQLPYPITDSLRLEIGLSGQGEIAIRDPKLFSVAALEGVYKGRRIVDEDVFDSLPNWQRAGLIVKPANMWSLAGLKFLITGYIPVGDWAQTAIAWTIPILLLLMGLLAVGVIMRQQWAENERYPFPLFQIPYALIGEADESTAKPFAAIWKNRVMWLGFGVGLAWSLWKGWAYYNPRVPNPDISIALSDYITGWGGMFGVTFAVSGIILAICIFFELNILISLVIGFFLFRSLYYVGDVTGLKVLAGYPFKYQQAIGAYLAYSAMIVIFARKYLWRVLNDAVKRNREASGHEAMTYRTAIIVIILAFVGIGLWAWWIEVSVFSILIYFFFLMTIGLVAAKFRAECGLPTGYFTPYNAMLFVSLMGGMMVFGAKGLLVCLIASGFLTVSVFFFIPGAQVEMLEFGRRYKIVPRHLIYTCLIGILGGLFIGGWVFLSNAYAIGGENIKYQWAFSQGWFFRSYMSELSNTTGDYLRQLDGESVKTGLDPAHWAYIGAGGATIIVTVLRQIFAGFWFHPIGIILGSAHMLEGAWGSVLAAWLIRGVVLLMGGASTVKNKLFPFFIGLFLGCMLSCLVFVLHGYYLQSLGIDRIYSALP